MKIAIIGAGISGLSTAYYLRQLAKQYPNTPAIDITLFEKENNIGGHTATKDVEVDGQHYAVDTGFIVFNDWTYPHFTALLEDIQVGWQNTSMGFSVKNQISGIEYAGNSLNTLFGQRRNIMSIEHWRLIKDIVRFNRCMLNDLSEGQLDNGINLETYLAHNQFSHYFKSHYLLPMASAIWSADTEVILNFSALFFARFFRNHGLLNIKKRPQWRVVKGGSRSYLAPLAKKIDATIITQANIQSVQRKEKRVIIYRDGAPHYFDQVVFACHSDQALKLLANPSQQESSILGSIPYRENSVVLHTDPTLLPQRSRLWSSWNYLIREKNQAQPILTYDMNILQNISSHKRFCVTLNATQAINSQHILGEYQYSHPQFSVASVKAAERWGEISHSGNQTWFAGAYWGYGFHEDGVKSGLKVAQALLESLSPCQTSQKEAKRLKTAETLSP